jgi:hypothetical protein
MFRNWVDRMDAASTPAARREVTAEMCRLFGITERAAYRRLRDAGWESGRARRRDAGTTAAAEPVLLALAEMERRCIRKNGKATLPLNVARSILEERGVTIPVGDGRLRELLRARHLSVKDMKAPAPYQPMRTEYPNQVHCADPSVALFYYPPGGKQKIIGDDENYKNKDFYAAKGGGKEKPKCWRYVLTDHYSGMICARYYITCGETAVNMYDFLLYAWGMKENPAYIFHGVPELLIWDCGSANIAKATANALKAFGVETKPHLPGNPRGKGQVENANNLVECHFESRLRFEPVKTLEELNDAVERWCAAWNANTIAGLDTRLKRSGQIIGNRAMLWNRIKPGQLRELPDKEACRQVFANGIQERKVAGDLTVSIVHPKVGRSAKYSVRGLAGIVAGMTVSLQPILVTEKPLCIVSYEDGGEARGYEIEPIIFDDAEFEANAPVFGKNYKRPKDTAREKRRKELETPEVAGAVAGPAHSFIKPSAPFLSQQEGTAIGIAETITIREILISPTEAALRYKAETGISELEAGFIEGLRSRFPEGVPVTEINKMIEERKRRAAPERDCRGEAVVITGKDKEAGAALADTEKTAQSDLAPVRKTA